MAGILSFKTVKKCGLDAHHYEAHHITKAYLQTFSILLVGVLLIAFANFSTLINAAKGYLWYFPLSYTVIMLPTGLLCIGYLGLLAWHGYRAANDQGNLYLIKLNLATLVAIFIGTLIDWLSIFMTGLFYAQDRSGFTGGVHNAFAYVATYWSEASFKYLLLAMIAGIAAIQIFIKRIAGNGHKTTQTSGKFGSAKFADIRYLKEHDLLSQDKSRGAGKLIVYGEMERQYIGDNEIQPRLVVAPQRTGKSTSVSIPFALDCTYNLFVLDVKGELFLTTYKERLAWGKKPIVVDVFGVLEQFGDFSEYVVKGCDPLNIDFDNPMQRERYLEALCDALIIIDDFDTNKHFIDAAYDIIRGILEAFIGKGYTLKYVYDRVILKPGINLVEYLEELNSDLESRYLRSAIAYLRKASDKERSGMETTILRSFKWLVSQTAADFFDQPGLNIDDFVHGNSDIFVVMPVDMIEPYARVVRLIVSMIGSAISRSPINKLYKYYPFLLDEIAQLQYFPYVEKMIETGGGYGIRVIALFQSLKQIHLYKKPDLFESMPVKQFFETDDIPTMDWIKRLGGTQTIQTESMGESMNNRAGLLKMGNNSTSSSVQETGVSLIHDDQIRCMPKDEQWLFLKGHRPIKCKKVTYYENRRYQGRFKNNPIEVRE